MSDDRDPKAVYWNSLQAYDVLPTPVVGIERETLHYANPAALDLLQAASADEVLDRSVFDFIHPLEHQRLARRLRRVVDEGAAGQPIELRVHTCRRQVRAVTATSRVALQTEDSVFVLAVMMDTTQWRMKKYLQETERNVNRLFENTTDLYYRIDAQGKVLRASPAVEHMLGYRIDEVIGQASAMFYADPGERDALIERLVRDGRVSDYEVQLRGKHGQLVDVSFSSYALFDDEGNYLAVEGVMRDITERKRLERRLQALASTDELTRVTNRRVFLERALQALHRARRNDSPMTLLILDIDWFKQLNDRFGHLAGDQALRCFAAAIMEQVRDIDLVGRLGGEEFGVVLEACARAEAEEVAERIRAQVEALRPGLSDGRHMRMTVSIGATVSTPSDERMEALLDRADRGLYSAKHAGRNRLAWHE